MMRFSALMESALTALVLSTHSTAAQQRALVGTVTAADSTPLGEATLASRGHRVVAESENDGRYKSGIPDSISRGVAAQLDVRLVGHAMQKARDFVHPIDTVDRSPGTRTHGGVITADLRIFGRVADSAGEGIPYASVILRGIGLGQQADVDGHYKIDVPPAKVTGRVAVLQIRQMGYAFRDDTVTLVGDAIHRDFTMFKPIYSERAQPLDRKSLRAMALSDLRNGNHRAGEREIRIRMDVGYFSSTLIRLVHNTGKTTGEMLSFIPSWSHEDSVPRPPKHHSELRTCGRGTDVVLPCRTAFSPEPDWPRLWISLDSLDIWNIVDEGMLRKRQTMILDGSQITAEIWDGHSYRAWSYASGVEDDGPGRAKVTVAAHLLHDLNLYAAP